MCPKGQRSYLRSFVLFLKFCYISYSDISLWTLPRKNVMPNLKIHRLPNGPVHIFLSTLELCPKYKQELLSTKTQTVWQWHAHWKKQVRHDRMGMNENLCLSWMEKKYLCHSRFSVSPFLLHFLKSAVANLLQRQTKSKELQPAWVFH